MMCMRLIMMAIILDIVLILLTERMQYINFISSWIEAIKFL
jgi:hypothetical protein